MAKTTDERLDEIEKDLKQLLVGFGVFQTHVGGIQKDVGDLERDFTSVRESVGTLRSTAARYGGGLAAINCFIVVVLIAGLTVTASYAGTWINDRIEVVSRRVIREEMAMRGSFKQVGAFTEANRTSEDEFSFRWNLNVPIESPEGAYVVAETHEPIPGIAVSAKLSDDGKSCIMTLHGSQESLAKIALPLRATITVFAK